MSEASYPEELLYHPEHDWARVEGTQAVFGVTWYAQEQLGEVVFLDLPKVGDTVTQNQSYAEIESVKAVSDVFAPLSGEVIEINEALSEAPELINDEPYGEGWLIKVELSEPEKAEELMDVTAYQALLP